MIVEGSEETGHENDIGWPLAPHDVQATSVHGEEEAVARKLGLDGRVKVRDW